MKLKIGNVAFDNPFFLAPLAGITDSAFRRLCKVQGAAMVYTEMVSSKGLYYDSRKSEELLCFQEVEKPIAFQIFGSEPEIMGWAVEELGERENALIDVNMGCPVPKVVKSGDGSALMKTPALAYEIIKSMVEAERKVAERLDRDVKPITAKFRLGWDESKINVKEFALRIQEAGASAVAIHGRTAVQMYEGDANWDLIGEVKEVLDIPVIGNGDVYSGRDAIRMMEETKCDFVMIARGSLGNPWIFREALCALQGDKDLIGPSLEEKLEMISRHIHKEVSDKGQRRGVQEMRKHIGWYIKGIADAAYFRRQINCANSVEDLTKVLEAIRASEG